jgi:hypothetical protein
MPDFHTIPVGTGEGAAPCPATGDGHVAFMSRGLDGILRKSLILLGNFCDYL